MDEQRPEDFLTPVVRESIRRQEVERFSPYLRHTSDCSPMLAGGPVNPIIECHCTCGLAEALKSGEARAVVAGSGAGMSYIDLSNAMGHLPEQ